MPSQDGLDWRWMRTLDADRAAPWTTVLEFLQSRIPADVDVADWFERGVVVDQKGVPLSASTPYAPNLMVWFPGPPPRDTPPADSLQILYVDERIVVIDKPHFQATTPQGMHARNTALVQVRTEGGFPEASPAHRLDRLTAGVLVFTIDARWRAVYQDLFAQRHVTRQYEALAPYRSELAAPVVRSSHIVKDRSSLQARELPDLAPNAHTTIAVAEVREGLARYRLTPQTGRTHQLRVHLNALGAPILHDPLYPTVLPADDQPREPLQLLARELSFVDPVDGTLRRFVSTRMLQWPVADCASDLPGTDSVSHPSHPA